MKYAKIETLFVRNEQFKITDEIRCAEFENIRYWWVTEKIDGTNIRVLITPNSLIMGPTFKGRTDKSQIPTFLLEKLIEMFPAVNLIDAFPYLVNDDKQTLIILYGEGYGVGINKGGNYRDEGVSFRLFDVWISDAEHPWGGWWLEPKNITDIASKLDIKTVPFIAEMPLADIAPYVQSKPLSIVAKAEKSCHPSNIAPMEGIVARPVPMLHNRKGERILFKLKVRDFRTT